MATNIKIEIKDKDYNTVYEETLTYTNTLEDGTTEEKNLVTQGFLPIDWDAKDSNGISVDDGKYTILATYKNVDASGNPIGETKYANVAHKIESVKFTPKGAELNIGDKFISMNKIKELY